MSTTRVLTWSDLHPSTDPKPGDLCRFRGVCTTFNVKLLSVKGRRFDGRPVRFEARVTTRTNSLFKSGEIIDVDRNWIQVLKRA